MTPDSFKDFITRLFGMPAPAPVVTVGDFVNLDNDTFDAGVTEIDQSTSDLGPVTVVLDRPIATIARPSESWSGNTVTAATTLGAQQLVGRNIFRSSLAILVVSGGIRFAQDQNIVANGGGATLAAGQSVNLSTMAEVWFYPTADSVISIIQEFIDGGNG